MAIGDPPAARARIYGAGPRGTWRFGAGAASRRDTARQPRGALTLRRTERERRRRTSAKGGPGLALDPAAQTLWTALRAWRLGEARRQELPPYVIFHDATLIEVARRRPVSLDALAEIPGIGRSKLERYGAALLAVTGSAM